MKARMQQVTDVQHIRAAMVELDVTAAELSRRLRVGQSAVSSWLGRGKAPAWTTVAVRALCQGEPEKRVTMVLSTGEKKAETVITLLDAMGIDYKQI